MPWVLQKVETNNQSEPSAAEEEKEEAEVPKNVLEGWKVYEEAEYSKVAFPNVTVALRHTCVNLETKLEQFKEVLDFIATLEFDETSQIHTGINCSVTKKEIVGVRYYAKCEDEGGEAIEVNLSEEAFHGDPLKYDLYPLVYLRLAHPLKPDQELPITGVHSTAQIPERLDFKVTINPILYSNRKALAELLSGVDVSSSSDTYFRKCLVTLMKQGNTL